MEQLDLSIDAAWAAGLLLAMTRVAAFVVVSPWLSRAVPLPGRLAVVGVLGLFLSSPAENALELPDLLASAVANAVVGGALGYLTGLLFHVFPIAGNLIDTISGLSVAAVFDPSQGEQGAVFGRLFNLTALALFFVGRGMELFVRGMKLSFEAIAVDGTIAASPDLVQIAVRGMSQMMVLGAELALPVLSVLFLLELVLGIASRFAPQANVFLLGLPAKLLVTLTTVGVVLMLFPGAMDRMLAGARENFVDALSGFLPIP